MLFFLNHKRLKNLSLSSPLLKYSTQVQACDICGKVRFCSCQLSHQVCIFTDRRTKQFLGSPLEATCPVQLLSCINNGNMPQRLLGPATTRPSTEPWVTWPESTWSLKLCSYCPAHYRSQAVQLMPWKTVGLTGCVTALTELNMEPWAEQSLLLDPTLVIKQ